MHLLLTYRGSIRAWPNENQIDAKMTKPRKKKTDYEFPPEIRAIWHAVHNLTFCPKFRRASADKVLEHIRQDNCKRCLAVLRQLQEEMDLIFYLMGSKN